MGGGGVIVVTNIVTHCRLLRHIFEDALVSSEFGITCDAILQANDNHLVCLRLQMILDSILEDPLSPQEVTGVGRALH